jgi:endoglucanase
VEAPKQELLQGVLMANSFIPITASPPVAATPSTKPSTPVVVNPTSQPVVVNPTSQPSTPVVVKPPKNQQPLITPPITGQAQLRVVSNLQSNWQSGFCMTMQVSNVGNTKVNDWQVSFQMNQAAINNSWNGNFKPQGSQYVATPMDWGRVIDPDKAEKSVFVPINLGLITNLGK